MPGFNAKLVASEKTAKAYEDLLKAQWKSGKISLDLEPVPVWVNPVMISARAPYPNAAMRFSL